MNLQFFYTDYVGLSAGLVSWSLLFARMFDAVTDPLMGYLSDRTHSSLGRRRPYFLGGAIPLGVAFYFLFTPPPVENPGDHQTFLLFYMLSLYVLTYLIWTIGAIPYFSLGAELTDDYQERVRVITIREGFALAGLLVATTLPAYLIHVYGGLRGYSFMGAALFLILSTLTVRERSEFHGRGALNPDRGWLETMRNPRFRTLILAFMTSAIAGVGQPLGPVAPDLVLLPAGLLHERNSLAAALELDRGTGRQEGDLGHGHRPRDAGQRRVLVARRRDRRLLHDHPRNRRHELRELHLAAGLYGVSLLALSRFRFTRLDLDDAQRKVGRA